MTPWTRVLRLDVVTSTNDVAKAKGKEGEPEGLVVVADRQSAGRGRMGRGWSSPQGGLYLSLLLRPGVGPDQVLRMTVLSCVPVAEAIEEVAGLRPRLKWPNDVLVRGRKVAGILAEGVSKGKRMEMVVLGIGINVNTPARELPPEATSLAAEAGDEVDPELLLERLLENLERFYARLKADEVDEDGYKSRSCVLGHRVEAQVGRETIRGKALYLEHDGALVLRSEEGLVLRLAWVNETSIRVTKDEENDTNP